MWNSYGYCFDICKFTRMPVGSRTVHEHLLHGNELPKSLIRKIPPNNDSNTDNIKSPRAHSFASNGTRLRTVTIRLERHSTSNSHNSPRTAPDFEHSQLASNGTRPRTVTNSPRTAQLASNGTTRLTSNGSIANGRHLRSAT